MQQTYPAALWGFGGDKMVVGRTLWDFIIEIVESPDLRSMLLALLVLAELAIIMLLLLAQSGLIAVKLSYGGLGVELRHLFALYLYV